MGQNQISHFQKSSHSICHCSRDLSGHTTTLPLHKIKGMEKIRNSHILNNLLLISVYLFLAYLLGWQKFLMVHLPVLMIFGSIAFWFFYIQHFCGISNSRRTNKYKNIAPFLFLNTKKTLFNILCIFRDFTDVFYDCKR